VILVKLYEDVEISDTERYQSEIGSLDAANDDVKIYLSNDKLAGNAANVVNVEAEWTRSAGLFFKKKSRIRRKIGSLPRTVIDEISGYDGAELGTATFKSFHRSRDRETFSVLIDIPVLQTENRALSPAQVLARAIRDWPAPPLPPGVFPAIGEYDDPEQGGEDISLSEGQSFAIRYADSKGRISTRRITAWGTRKLPNGAIALVAWCHERKAKRVFRVDRINAAIDYSGLVHQPAAGFLRDIFGLSMPALSDEDSGSWRNLRASMRPHVQMMAALTRPQGVMREREIYEILPFAARIWPAFMEAENRLRLVNLIRRSRPVPDIIEDVFEEMLRLPKDELVASLQACKRVIEGEGVPSGAQTALFNLISEELIGDMLF